MNILIIRFSSMGDVILAAPALAQTRERWPRARLVFLTSAVYAPLFSADPSLSQVVACDPYRLCEVYGILNRTQWDRVYDLQNSARSGKLVRALRSPGRVRRMHKRYMKRLLLLLFRCDTYHREKDHVVRRYLDTVEESGEPMPAPRITIDPQQLRSEVCAASDTMHDRPVLALIPFSTWKNKTWPASSFIEVGRHFIAKGWTIALFGGPQDRKNAEAMQHMLGTHCVVCAGQLQLHETAYALSCCRLALGNDTGLSHLARARGVPTAMVFGSTTAHWGFFPYGEPPYTIFERSLWCRPCHLHGGNVCLRVDRPCLRSITSESVIRGLEDML
jgi:heptosyltransferase-2